MNLLAFFQQQDEKLRKITEKSASQVVDFFTRKVAEVLEDDPALVRLSRGQREQMLNLIKARKFNELESLIKNLQARDILSIQREDIYERTIILIDEELDELGLTSGLTKEQLQGIFERQDLVISEALAEQTASIRAAVIEKVILGESVTERSLFFKDLTKAGAAKLRSEIDTQTMAMYRKMGLVAYENNGIDKLQYFGSLIFTSRPFCRRHIGQVKSRSKWAGLDNGQGLPVLSYCGGYRCRHHLIPYDEELEKDYLEEIEKAEQNQRVSDGG